MWRTSTSRFSPNKESEEPKTCSDTQAPDPLIGRAALDNAAIARDALAWYKQKDLDAKPRQDKMDAIATRLAEQQISTSATNDKAARSMLGRYETVGVPAEDAMYKDAREYDSQAKLDQAAGQAATDVDVSVSKANDARRRAMARSGVNPADGRSLATEQEASTQAALGKATAMNSARDRIKNMGVMLRKDAANFAKGMSSNAATTFGTAAMAGSGATGALGAAGAMQNASTQANGAGFGTAISGNNGAANIMQSQYNSQQQDSGIAGAVGGIAQGIGSAGGIAAFFSDQTMKEEIEPVDDDEALEGIENTPVSEWQYKAGSKGDDGGQRHVGAMAQDMQKNMGEQVAPGGKVVDVISAIGTNMAATRALSKKVDRLASKLAAKGTRNV